MHFQVLLCYIGLGPSPTSWIAKTLLLVVLRACVAGLVHVHERSQKRSGQWNPPFKILLRYTGTRDSRCHTCKFACCSGIASLRTHLMCGTSLFNKDTFLLSKTVHYFLRPQLSEFDSTLLQWTQWGQHFVPYREVVPVLEPGVETSVLCGEVVPISEGPLSPRFYCIATHPPLSLTKTLGHCIL